MDVKSVTIEATFGGILPGDPPRLLYHKRLTRQDGKRKPVSAAAEIRDAKVLERARAVKTGCPVRLKLTTDWSAEGLPSWVEELHVRARSLRPPDENVTERICDDDAPRIIYRPRRAAALVSRSFSRSPHHDG